jgi:hypothetical protein
MKIVRITSQHYNDFSADIVCEHCNAEAKLKGGYDDHYYHNSVLPRITCKNCGRIRSGEIPLAPNDTGSIHIGDAT